MGRYTHVWYVWILMVIGCIETRCCSGCSIICTRSYRRALLMIRINDAESLCLASTAALAASSLEMRPSISLCRSRSRRRSRSPVSHPSSLADAFAYKLLLMSRYQSDCINVAASSVERRASRYSCNARPLMPAMPCGPRAAFIRSYSCIAGLMLIFPGSAGQAIDVWITLT